MTQLRIRPMPFSSLIASLMCVAALLVFLLVNPAPVRSQIIPEGCGQCQCEKEGNCSDQGACVGGQRCKTNVGCTQSWWEDDRGCQ
jgi:hypothetical protein